MVGAAHHDMQLGDRDDAKDGGTRIRYTHQTRPDTVGKLRHILLDSTSSLVVSMVRDDASEGAGHAGLQGHGALAVQAGPSTGVTGEAKEQVEQLEVRSQGKLNLLEVQELDNGPEVAMVLRPPLTMGQDQGSVYTSVPLPLLFTWSEVLWIRKPGNVKKIIK